MVSFAALRAVTRRHVQPLMFRNTQKRGMALGGSHGPPPEWTGVDKVVRSYFPEDYQLAIAILSGYLGLGILYKISSAVGGKKVEEEKPAPKAAAPTTTTGVPSIESPEFERFIETEAFEKLLENEEQLGKIVESV